MQPLSDPIQQRAVDDVLDERARQDARWGVQNHDTITYLAILMEEVGETAQAALEMRFGGPRGTEAHVRAEAVQVAAVALAIVECLDRGQQPPVTERP
jgi:NTP pyrophosphatase (non-canonical NTP hydrolase)